MTPHNNGDVVARIDEAYRWILGRAPDAVGLATYRDLMEAGTLSQAGLREALLASPEFARSRENLCVVDTGNKALVVVDALEPEFGRAIAESGSWEPHILQAIASILKPGDTYVDIGANVGVMAFHAARAVGENDRVIAFEPNPENAALFQRGMLSNDFRNVRLHIVAAAEAFDLIAISRLSNAKAQVNRDPLGFNFIVQADRLDNYLAGEDRINLIKIDIEGFELPALRGLRDTIARHKPTILCEFNPLCIGELGFDVREVAAFYFSIARRIEVIDHEFERIVVSSSDTLLELWRERNAEAVRTGALPDGWVHFDLLMETRG